MQNGSIVVEEALLCHFDSSGCGEPVQCGFIEACACIEVHSDLSQPCDLNARAHRVLNRASVYINNRTGIRLHMSTPAMIVASMLKIMIICLGVFWVVSFSVGRIFIFYESYTSFLAVLKDEEWLRVQCALPEFYTNMRQHTELCSTVMFNAARSPLLIALNDVAGTAHLCGRNSCADVLVTLSNAGWPVIVTVVALLLVAPVIILRIARMLVLVPHHHHSALPHQRDCGKYL